MSEIINVWRTDILAFCFTYLKDEMPTALSFSNNDLIYCYSLLKETAAKNGFCIDDFDYITDIELRGKMETKIRIDNWEENYDFIVTNNDFGRFYLKPGITVGKGIQTSQEQAITELRKSFKAVARERIANPDVSEMDRAKLVNNVENIILSETAMSFLEYYENEYFPNIIPWIKRKRI